MSLSGRVAVITGASSGIGLACAEQLAREGVAVMLGARRADRLQAAVDGIQANGGRAAWVAMDVTFELEVNELVKRARELFGGLDIMICNAGFGFYGTPRRDAAGCDAADDGSELHRVVSRLRGRRCRSSGSSSADI